jgi:hypothetical protein
MHGTRIFLHMSVNVLVDVMTAIASMLNQSLFLGLVKKLCCLNFSNRCSTVEVCLVCRYAG